MTTKTPTKDKSVRRRRTHDSQGKTATTDRDGTDAVVAATAGAPDGARACTPLEVQLATMRDLWARAVNDGEIVDLELAKQACALAKDTAPFVHPRLASVDHSGDMTVRHEDWLDSLPD